MALELLEDQEKAHAGTAYGRFVSDLRSDIEQDRRELEALMKRLKIAVSSPRKAVAWLTEKATQLKLAVDDPSDGSLRRLEAIEAVAVGIEGKRALWRALAAASEGHPGLDGMDYARLEQRALEQRNRAETVRLEAARAALTAVAM